jgi:hypothetical protein
MADQETNTGGTGTEGLDDAFKNAQIRDSQSTNSPYANIAEEVGLLPRPLEQIPSSDRQGRDLAQILEEVKLPERKEFHATADIKPIPPTEPLQEEPPVMSETTPKPRDTVSAIHTLKDDFQTAVYDQKLSLVQAAALQQEKRAHSPSSGEIAYAQTARRTRTIGTFLAIGILLTLGIIAFGAVAIIIRDRSGVEPTTFLAQGILFSEQTVPLPIQSYSTAELKRQLAGVRVSQGLTLGAITRIAPVINEKAPNGEAASREATTREFFSALEASVPEELLRAIANDFFFGFHTVDENAPLIIIPVESYERAFAGMLEWERTMNADLTPIFTSVPLLKRQADGLLSERQFEDTVMQNFDVRELKDDNGDTQLYYSFPTRTILIIAESKYSFPEILSRLRADRRL